MSHNNPNYTPRNEVYEAIDDEREYQHRKWGERVFISVGEATALLEEYSERARRAYADGDNKAALHMIRKVGAIAVNAMEIHGAPLRKPG